MPSIKREMGNLDRAEAERQKQEASAAFLKVF
jgi:hypothetical protein